MDYQVWRIKHNEYQRQYRATHPKETEARNMINNSLARREIPYPFECELCGSTEYLVKHHPDYDYPLIIVVLCKSCHNFIHAHPSTLA